MEKNFSSSEARQLINEYQRLERDKESFRRTVENNRQLIKSEYNFLSAQETFSKDFSDALLHDADISIRMPGKEYFKLIGALYSARKYVLIESDIQQLDYSHLKEIKGLMDSLKPAAQAFGLRWVFTSSITKENAILAYEELSDRYRKAYLDKTNNYLDIVKIVETDDEAVILNDFKEYRSSYLAIFKKVLGYQNPGYNSIKETQSIFGLYDELDNYVNEADKQVLTEKKNTIDAIEQYLAEKAVDLLDEVPVEEVNREKKGIRIKTLKENGYKSMADIYAATSVHLSSINGITTETAEYCKKVAIDYLEKLQPSVKIRLNTDDKTRASTLLVKGLHKYIIKRNNQKRIMETADPYLEDVCKRLEVLKNAGNGVLWFFIDDDQARNIVSAYNYLSEFFNSQAYKAIREAGQAVKEDYEIISTNAAWQDFGKDPIGYINALEEISPGIMGGEDTVYGLPEDLAREIRDEAFFPEGLKCTLRRYQEWGVKYTLHQERVLLGDEMGLGKTVQAIAVMVSLKNTGATHFLVVCPASVIENWCREVVKHSKLRVTRIHGNDREKQFDSWLKTGSVGVTTYETLALLNLTMDYKFNLLVVDEAHYAKNPKARRSKNIRELSRHTDRILFMTGTALENNVEEMISLIRILDAHMADSIRGIAFLSSAPQFRTAVAPVYYRRKREDVLNELPDLIENQEWCTLSRTEWRAYEESVVHKNYADVRRVSWNIDDIRYSSKANRMKELVEEAKEEGRKVIVFSFFTDTIKKVCRIFGKSCYGPINGSVPPAKRQEIIDKFDKAPGGSVLAAQIQAGGTGLNIQSASIIILCEPQFKPSIENQAISRAYRMGQSRSVLVYRLLCKDTVDERIVEMLEEKQRIFDAFADKSVAADNSVQLDEKSFGDIIKEEIDRINAKNGKIEEELEFEHEVQNDDDNKEVEQEINDLATDDDNKGGEQERKYVFSDDNDNKEKQEIEILTPDNDSHVEELDNINVQVSPMIRSNNVTEEITRENSELVNKYENVDELLARYGIPYKDNRESGGGIWIVGGDELDAFIKEASDNGFEFVNKGNVGRSSSKRYSWCYKE